MADNNPTEARFVQRVTTQCSITGEPLNDEPPRKREYRPFFHELTAGPGHHTDDTSDPDYFAIYGRTELEQPEGPCDSDGLPLTTKEMLRDFDYRVECWERECREILAIYTDKKWPDDPLPDSASEHEKDAFRLLFCTHGLRNRVQEFDLGGAVVFAFNLSMIGLRMKTRWANDPTILGQKNIEGRERSKRRRAAEAVAHAEEWQRIADPIWANDPDRPAWAVARQVANQYAPCDRPKPGTIRSKIKPPVQPKKRAKKKPRKKHPS